MIEVIKAILMDAPPGTVFMPLDFEPESLLALRSRFSKALERIWDATDGDADTRLPTHDRRYVFDSLSGIRFLVTRVRQPGSQATAVMIAVFISPNIMAAIDLSESANGSEFIQKLMEKTETMYREISCDKQPIRFVPAPGGGLIMIAQEE